jgi:dUTP pyrophosphatase
LIFKHSLKSKKALLIPKIKMFKVKRLSDRAFIPVKKHARDAGWDLHSPEDIILKPNVVTKINTGLSFSIPEGYYGRIADRSSMALKGITNLAGVIDSDYRGEVSVVLINLNSTDYEIKRGDRISQLILTTLYPVHKPLQIVESLENTERGTGGFGSTGK